MEQLNFINDKLKELTERNQELRRLFDYVQKHERLTDILNQLESPDSWRDPEKFQALGKERVKLSNMLSELDAVGKNLQENRELLELAIAEEDYSLLSDLELQLKDLEQEIAQLEFKRMFSGKMDANNAFLDIQSGSGGTEAQDWAEMLLRMYLRWAEKKGFTAEILEISPGEVAGIKSASVKFIGSYAYGWLRTETGIHRLVRKSPFDSGNRRHTSFASVFVFPEVDEDIEVAINPAELRIDTYRASGAGGQHVNRTDSAVRITHLPTNIVVQCQSDRSQHKNRSQAMQQLRAKLYELELKKREAEREILEESKAEISWGSQIRSYVLDASRIKDLRTGVETSNTQAVLDGEIDQFIEASLKEKL